MRASGYCLCVLIVALSSAACAQQSAPTQLLPNAAQTDFLRRFENLQREAPDIQSAPVRSFNEDSAYFKMWSESGRIDQPLQAYSRVLVLLNPALTPNEIEEKINEYRLDVISAEPAIGLLTVNVSRLREARQLGSFPLDLDSGQSDVSTSIDELAKDPAFISVVPDTVLTPFQFKSSVVPSQNLQFTVSAGEVTDWGINDAKIGDAWAILRGQEFKEGIIDVGFANHEDLSVVSGLPQQALPVDSHGNHVAGIMCGQHNNKGIKGVLPNCTAVIATGSFILNTIDPIESRGTVRWHTLFSELVATVLDFIDNNPDVKNINLSLGYNWVPNFNIDPVDGQHSEIRDSIRNQGRIFLSILALAKTRDIAIMSAAGNDSSNLSNPTLAKWSSPFNWATLAMKGRDGWSNGLVVEAHDKNGKRAKFSNVGGDISAPGVDIYSATSGGTSSYGTMSGTSMASPYVAASLALLRKVRPELNLEQAIVCLVSSPGMTDSGTPKLDLMNAIRNCQQ